MANTRNTIGVKLMLTYGESEIVGWQLPWRIEMYRPFVVHPNEPWNREIRERVMAQGPDDTSSRHYKSTGYDSNCSCCYLNIYHTVNKHNAGIQR